MKTKTLILVSLVTVLISCSKQGQYNQFVDFGEENRWQKTDIKTFEFDVTDATPLYNLIFKFSHVYDYQFDSVPINFIIESPDAKKENIPINLIIKDNNQKQLAECSGDICDLNYKIKEKIKLIKGKYKITISHNFKGPYLPNVIGIGFKVESVK